MVFAINPPTEGEKTFDNFLKKALEFGQQSSLAPTATQDCSTTDTMTNTVTKAAAAYVATYPTSTYYGETSPPASTYYSETNSAAPAPTEYQGTQYRVMVGVNGTLTYDPQFVSAKPQDTIVCETGL